MAKLLATDLDGTLLYPVRLKVAIPKKNAKFIRDWIDNGNRVVCVSSRTLSFLPRLEKETGRQLDFIGASSAQISVKGEVVKDTPFDNKILKEIIPELDKKYHPFVFILSTDKHPFCIKTNIKRTKWLAWFYRTYWKMQFARKERYVLDETTFNEEIDHGKVYKVIVFFGLGKKNTMLAKEATKEIREKYEKYNVIEASWSKMVIELTPYDCHKAIGLKEYCEREHFDPSDVYVVGDSGNDITVFKEYYEHSYCLKHSYPSVKKYAKHTIRRVYNLEKVIKKEKKHE